MPISEPPVARRPQAAATPSRDGDPARERGPEAAARPIRTDRIEVCLDCEAFIVGDGPLPDGRDPELREVERGVSRLGVARGDQAVTVSSTGERIGHRDTPCGSCRRPLAGERVVVERAVRHGPASDRTD